MATLLLFGFSFGAGALAGLGSWPAWPWVLKRFLAYRERRAAEATDKLGELFMELAPRQIRMAYVVIPIATGVFILLLTRQWLVGLIGAAAGLVLPRLIVRYLEMARQKKFHDQLVDGLLVLSSSLKAGLSMLQAFSVLAEEMPPPISQEFGLVIKKTQMGVNLAEALSHVKRRVPSDDINLFVTAVLVARETGGDLTQVFSRLVETLRERKKLKERVKTLTFMARMQGTIMAMLPFAFSYLVYTMNKDYFYFFVHNPTGRVMLLLVVALQVIGCCLFVRFSRSPL